jgi:hypothetical protein
MLETRESMQPKVAIVGVCASGKSTLSEGLKAAGIPALTVPQEHSSVRRLWERLHPDCNILVMLDACWETAQRRRPTLMFGPEGLERQARRLDLAREACHLYMPTDDLTIADVRERVLSWIDAWKAKR